MQPAGKEENRVMRGEGRNVRGGYSATKSRG
jgi:hypothetical protein